MVVEMYWLGIEELKAELRAGTLAERDMVSYLIAQGIVLQLSLAEASANAFALVECVFGVLTTVFGTWYVFNLHVESSKSSFLQKFVTLGWVVSIRWVIFFLPLIVIAGCFLGDLGLALAGIAFSLVYFWRLGEHVADC